MRQIPYTMMKFAAFERTVEFLYKYVVPVPRDQLGKPSQLVVTFAAGYIAGVLCTLVSHPADSIVSKLNSQAGSSIWESARQLGMAGMDGGDCQSREHVFDITSAFLHSNCPRPCLAMSQ